MGGQIRRGPLLSCGFCRQKTVVMVNRGRGGARRRRFQAALKPGFVTRKNPRIAVPTIRFVDNPPSAFWPHGFLTEWIAAWAKVPRAGRIAKNVRHQDPRFNRWAAGFSGAVRVPDSVKPGEKAPGLHRHARLRQQFELQQRGSSPAPCSKKLGLRDLALSTWPGCGLRRRRRCGSAAT